MSLWQRVRKILGSEKSVPQPPSAPPYVPAQEEEPEIVVPEITAEQLQVALSESEPPLVIDVREPYEWRLVRMAAARHLPMNEVPTQIESIPRDRAVVVMCAHGSRSYSVAAWLIEQGINASSLAGGITQWARYGGEIEQG